MFQCEMLLYTAEVISGAALGATAMTLKLLDTTLSEKCLFNHSRTMFCYSESEEEKGKTWKSVFTQKLGFCVSVKRKASRMIRLEFY